MHNEHIKNIIKGIDRLGRIHSPEVAFRDWCEMYALALYNVCTLHNEQWKAREQRYLDLIAKYDTKVITTITAELVLAFEKDPFNDHLGNIYMELFGGNKNLGQCFTPRSICELCAGISFPTPPKNGECHSLLDPCCGGGAMIIAFLEQCYLKGYNYQKYLTIEADDLDSLCVHMTYIQLSLLGARAVVKHQNSLSLQLFSTFYTPMEILRFPFITPEPEGQTPKAPEPLVLPNQPEKGQLLLF